LYKRQGKEKAQTAMVGPGEEKTLFELPLDDILLPGRQKERVYNWSWIARPAPPESPIYHMRQKGFVDQADFWAEVKIEGKDYRSEKVVLKVTGGRPKP